MPRLACYALTPDGLALARKIASACGADIHAPRRHATNSDHPFDALAPHLATTFHAYTGHILMAATGIVIRCIAPLLRDKSSDPAVVVCDQAGRFAISLLAGHLGGANDLARRVATITGGMPVITTATDTAGLPSFDLLARDAGCAIDNIDAVKTVNAALLEGRTVTVFDPLDRLGLVPRPPEAMLPYAPEGSSESAARLIRHAKNIDQLLALPEGSPCVLVTWHNVPGTPWRLVLHPPVVHAGIGCRKGASAKAIENLLAEALTRANVAPAALGSLATADIKQNEPGLQAVAAARRIPLRCHSGATLAAVPVPNPSPKAAQVLGTGPVGVAEAAARLAAASGRLILEKIKGEGVTVALAVENEQ